MSTGNLTTVSYVVLGCVAWRGPSTSYELNAYVDRAVSWVWDFNRSHLYAEPPRLVEAGYLTEDREEAGRRRRRYSITPAGREALRSWVAEPVTKDPEYRDVAMIKLFFGRYGERSDIVEMATARVADHRRRLAEIDALMKAGEDDAERLAFQRATGELGLRLERLLIQFWADVAADPPTA